MAVDFSAFTQYSALRNANRLLFADDYEPVWILNSEEVQLKEIMQYYPAMPEPPKPPPPPPKPGVSVRLDRSGIILHFVSCIRAQFLSIFCSREFSHVCQTLLVSSASADLCCFE